MYKRIIEKHIIDSLFKKKIIVIYGARQVGKTTLLKKLEKKFSQKKSRFFNCDNLDVRDQLINQTSFQLKRLFGDSEIVFIDEAQRVKNIGLTLKIAIDSMPDKQFIVSGSSSFDLANKINEPLTGRKFEYHLPPLLAKEIASTLPFLEQERLLDQWLTFGFYPDIVNHPASAELSLVNLVQGTLYKDVFEHQDIRHSELLSKLLKALAFQIGQEVSFNELAGVLKTNKATVQRYVSLLEQSFIIFRLTPFSRNLRNELKKKRKIYFYDIGVRNALIKAFGPVDLRNDKGALWENFLISEKMKINMSSLRYVNEYYWRTHAQEEIDYIEEKDLKLSAFEFKWNTKKRVAAPKAFSRAYPDSSFESINKENFRSFVGLG